MKGIYLISNQGTLIIEGKKTLIVKKKKIPEDYLDKEVYLCQDDLVLGIIKLSNEKTITLKEFEELKDKHLISEEDRKSWWKDAESLYAYDVKIVEKFEKLKKFEHEQGVQNYIQEVKFKKEITTTDDIDHLEVLYDAEKLHLEEFKATGIDGDLKHPKTKYKQLLADLRYLENGGYPKLKANEKWGDWDLKTLLEYFAKVIDALRSIYMPLMPKDDKNSFWNCYREAEQYMKSKPPKEEEVAEWDKKREKLIKSISDGQYVVCEDCDVEIDYLGTIECAMGAIACPNCKSIIDQYGSLLNKRYDPIAPAKLEKLTDEELKAAHKEAHKIWQLYESGKFKDLELLVNNHILIVQEMLRRKIKHEKEDKLDEESLEFNRDYDKDEKELLFKHEELHSFDFAEEDNFYDFKSVLERHDEIIKSLENFDIQHNSKEDFLDDYVEFMKRRSNLAAVHPSGKHNKHREVIKLEEVLPYFKSFKLRSPFIYLTGGLTNNEQTTNDIDILINCTQEELDKIPLFQMLTWRLMRSLPRRYWKKIQFLSNKWQGPITNNIPIYELACLRTNLDNKIFQMSHQDNDEEFIKALIRTKNPKSEKQAQKAKREDKVTLGEFFLPQKPMRGAFENQRMTVDSFLSLFKEEDYPIYNSSKRDGFHNILIKDKDKVTIFSEDGSETTKRFPTLVKEISKLNINQCVLLAEIEMWIEKIHQPREVVSGYAHLKSEPDDSSIVASVYDCVFYNKDVHDLSFELRKQLLDKLNFRQSTNGIPNVDIKLNKIPHYRCKNKEELRRTTEKLRNIESSEGVVASMAKATYNLAGKRSGSLKFHNNAAISVVVLDKQKTKIPGTSNYYYGVEIEKEKVDRNRVKKIGSNNYLLLGKTFSTTASMKTGDKFILEFETLNVEYHEKTDELKLTCWVPRFIQETNEAVDTIKSTITAAKKENHVLQEKDVLETGEIIYKSVEFEKQDPYEIIPEEEDAPYKYTVQHHARGKTIHSDLRIESKDKKFLIGWTIMDLIEGKIKDPILTMKDAAKANSEDNFKIEWNKKPVKVKMRRTAAGNIVPAEIRSATKAAEPSAWLDVTGVTKPGEVGATKDFPGVFTMIDKGTVEYLAQKPYFKELWFSNQGKLQGRWIFRQISEYRREEKTKGILPASLPPERPETSGFFWVLIQPIDQVPYVLGARAIEKNWVPPVRYSALPQKLKKKVSSEFQYWKAAKESDRIRIRNSYVEWLKENKQYDELKKCGAIDISEGQRPRIDEVMILSSYLSCEIKDIFPKIISIPRVRAGNYFDSLVENTKNCTLVEIRNFASCEIPPIYEEIQLKKNLVKPFLIEGFYFFHDEEKQTPFIVQVAPVWGGFIIKIISRTRDKDFNLELSKKIEQYAKDNNMLKGEKFTISGEFIDAHNLTWEDLKLSTTIKERLKHLDYLIQNNEDGLASRGLLFLGPPGCGKTLTGKILSNSKPTFIWITSKDFAYTSVIGAVTTAFSLARELSPTIIFAEDIDSYISREVVDVLKTELDGLQLNKGVFTVLTSNFPEKLPEALIDRPGRFHDVLYFSLPNEEVRNEMFSHFLKNEEYDPEILEVLVRKTNGFSGAHIKEICDFAKIIKKEDNVSLAKALMTSLDKVIEQRKLIASFKNNHENQFNRFITEDELMSKAIGTFKFVLQHHWFKRWNWKEDKPVIVVRSGASEEHWDLRIDTGETSIMHWVLDNDPREVASTTALYKPCNDKSSMDKGKPNENKDYLKPGTSEWNPTKDTRAWLDLEDSGEAIITIDKPMFKRVELRGKTLKGLFTLEREDEKSDFWILSKAKLPETKKTEEVTKK